MSSLSGLSKDRKDHQDHRFKKPMYPDGINKVSSAHIGATHERRSLPSWDKPTEKITF